MKKKKEISLDNKLNMLRAGVLGANDGILTVVGVLFSVIAATTNPFIIFIAGLSDLLSCAFPCQPANMLQLVHNVILKKR